MSALRARDVVGWRVGLEPGEYEVVQGARPGFPVGCRVDLPQACQGEDDVVWIKSGAYYASLLGYPPLPLALISRSGASPGGQLVTGLPTIRRIRRVRAIGLRLTFSHDLAGSRQPL